MSVADPLLNQVAAHPPFLQSIVVFLVAAVVLVPLTKRFKLGAVLGYLIGGILIGPQVLKLVDDPELVLSLSELGVVLLLFVLGLELSPNRLWVMRRVVFGFGAAQVALSTAVLALVAVLSGFLQGQAALVAAFGLSLSSTAFVLQILAERNEFTAQHGRLGFGNLLFQDIIAVPVLAILPLLAVEGVSLGVREGWLQVIKVIGAIGVVIFAGRYLLRPLLRYIASSNSHEVFAAASLLVVFGTAWLMQVVGLSMGLGAFLAGVLLADSEYQHEVESHIDPFKGLLLGLFFMAVGMGLNLALLIREPLLIATVLLVMLLLKGGIMFALTRAFGQRGKGAAILAALIAPGGEFAFVVFNQAALLKIIPAESVAILNVSVALSMTLTPFMVIGAAALFRKSQISEQRAADTIDDEHAEVVIAGYGRFGQIIARVLSAQRIPFIAIDPSTEQVDLNRKFGGKLYYGNPTRPELLRSARVAQAKVFVLAIDDPADSVRTARLVRRLFPKIRILARARNRNHVFKLMELGVEQITRETLHSALVMTHQLLEELGYSAQVAADRVDRFKTHDEEMLKEQYLVHDNEDALVQSAKQSRDQLEQLFEADADISGDTHRSGRPSS
jgi:glutathione-regulated potassium-efflux system protein KefB